MDNLAAHILESRAGDPSKAKQGRGRPPGAKNKEQKKKEAETKEDMETAESMAEVLAEGEAGFAYFFVPDDKSEAFEKRSSKVLKTGWKYWFVENGVESIPAWAVLLIAHLVLVAGIVKGNWDRLEEKWNGWFGKVEKKDVDKKPVNLEKVNADGTGKVIHFVPPPASPQPIEVTAELKPSGKLETGV